MADISNIVKDFHIAQYALEVEYVDQISTKIAIMLRRGRQNDVYEIIHEHCPTKLADVLSTLNLSDDTAVAHFSEIIALNLLDIQ